MTPEHDRSPLHLFILLIAASFVALMSAPVKQRETRAEIETILLLDQTGQTIKKSKKKKRDHYLRTDIDELAEWDLPENHPCFTDPYYYDRLHGYPVPAHASTAMYYPGWEKGYAPVRYSGKYQQVTGATTRFTGQPHTSGGPHSQTASGVKQENNTNGPYQSDELDRAYQRFSQSGGVTSSDQDKIKNGARIKSDTDQIPDKDKKQDDHASAPERQAESAPAQSSEPLPEIDDSFFDALQEVLETTDFSNFGESGDFFELFPSD